MTKQNEQISKFLSYVLRHEPQAIGLTLDSEGWAALDALVDAARRSGRQIDVEQIRAVVSSNDKKRFAISEDGLRIRAVQGHSTASVAIRYEPRTPPQFLYHGTATRFLDSILKEGLKPGERHYVHLSSDIPTAIAVGRRHGKVVVLRVDALVLHREGREFFRAENGVWLTASVPAHALVTVEQD